MASAKIRHNLTTIIVAITSSFISSPLFLQNHAPTQLQPPIHQATAILGPYSAASPASLPSESSKEMSVCILDTSSFEILQVVQQALALQDCTHEDVHHFLLSYKKVYGTPFAQTLTQCYEAILQFQGIRNLSQPNMLELHWSRGRTQLELADLKRLLVTDGDRPLYSEGVVFEMLGRDSVGYDMNVNER